MLRLCPGVTLSYYHVIIFNPLLKDTHVTVSKLSIVPHVPSDPLEII